MSLDRQKLAALGKRLAPDPTWKARQAFIRATRRGSKKHTSMEGKLALLDAATSAIPQPKKLNVLDLQRKRMAEESAALLREQQAMADELKARSTPGTRGQPAKP